MAVIDSTWSWRQLNPATPPPSRSQHAMCWAGDRVIMFGGVHFEGGLAVLDDTWELVDDEWNELSPGTVPSERGNQQMAYDGSRVLMMGGETAGPTVRDETWEYVASDWNQLSIATPIYSASSPVRYPYLFAMDWDDLNSRLIALIPTDTGNQTWQYTSGAGDWSHLSLSVEFLDAVSGLGYRERFGGCWAGDRFVVMSGGAGNASYRNDIMELNSTTWSTEVAYNSGGTTPYPWRFDHYAVWTGGEVFFYGGERNPTSSSGPTEVLDDQYVYEVGGTLNTFSALNSPPPARYRFAICWTGERIVLHGGQHTVGGFTLDDTWVLEPPGVTPVAGRCVYLPPTMVGVTARQA